PGDPMTRSPAPTGAPPLARRGRERLIDGRLLIGIAVVAMLLVASLLTGVYDIFGTENGGQMFAITRIPRTIALVLAGAAMAMSGLIMQLMTQNRFVEPSTTGTTEWAGLGLIVVMVLMPDSSILTRMVVAIVFAFVGTMVFFAFLRQVTLRSSLIVPIIGIMLGAVVSSVSTFVALQFDALQNLGVWFAGSFPSVLRGQYDVPWVVATGVVTVVVGNLPFLGLIVPNIVSMVRGDDLRSNLPWVALLGIAIVTLCDLVARTIIMPFEVPVSLILGMLGAAVFIAMILRQ